MILAHKTIGEDELLHHYALLPWNKLYAAQKALEEKLATVLEESGPDRWVMKPGARRLGKTKRLAELRSAGVSASAIAKQLDISFGNGLSPSASEERASGRSRVEH